jgi:hypothetical protein
MLTKFEPLVSLAERYHAAYERCEHGAQEWIDGMLEIAAVLSEAREKFPADREFSHWLVDNGMDDFTPNDRAALINMGKQMQVLRDVLIEQREQVLPNTIWQKSRARFQIDLKPDSSESESPLPPISAPTPVVSEKPPVENTVKQSSVPLPARSPFKKLPRGDEVYHIYRSSKSRGEIAKAAQLKGVGKRMWQLILTCMDQGFLTPTDAEISVMTLRVLFPNSDRSYRDGFHLVSKPSLDHIENVLMPAAIANRERVIAEPHNLGSIVKEHQEKQAAIAKREKLKTEIKKLPSNEQEVTMYGVTLWPINNRFGTYNYDQLSTAIWSFNDLDTWIQPNQSPESRAICIRHSLRWNLAFLKRNYSDEEGLRMRKVYTLIGALATLMATNPDGECKSPPSPKIEETT